MKKIVRLTESDLTRIVKKVLLEENQNTISKDQFRKLRTIGRPKIYEDKNFISLNWNDPKLIGNNILTITYREGENYFDVILTDKPSGRFCEKLKNVSLLLKQNGGNGNYTTNKSTCGGQFFFGIEKFNSLQEFLPKLHSMIFNLTESDLTRIVRRVINEESMDCSKLKVIPKSGIKGLNTNGKPQSPTWNEDIRKIGNATTVYFFEGSKVDAINTQRKCYRAKKEVTYLEFKRNDGTSYVMIGVD